MNKKLLQKDELYHMASLSYLDEVGYSKVNLNACFHLFRSGVSHEIFYLNMSITLHSFAVVLQ